MTRPDIDKSWMRQTIDLARRGLWTTTPNPRVGCILVKDEKKIGMGWHEKAGGPHAEVFALKEAGELARGATAYVTLEPCSHFGRTPPCADALIAAGVQRVVIAMSDPNPQVSGRGIQRLKAAGLEVETGICQSEAQELNPGFISRMTRGRPWVRLKVATSLDGQTALPDGTSQWITSPDARIDGQRYRAQACAVLTGIGTILADDPQLNVRDFPTPRQPQRIVVDSQLRTPLDARILQNQENALLTQPTLIASPVPGLPHALNAVSEGLLTRAEPSGRVDLHDLMSQLGARGINELHVEAGACLNGALLMANLVDEIIWYQAPCLLGPGRPAFDLPPLEGSAGLDGAPRFVRIESTPVGPDLRMTFRNKHS